MSKGMGWKRRWRQAMSALLAAAMVLGLVPSNAFAYVVEQATELGTQDTRPKFVEQNVELYVGETKTIRLDKPCEDNNGFRYSYCLYMVDGNAQEMTIQGVFPGSGTATIINGSGDESYDIECNVTVKARDEGFVYASGETGDVTWQIARLNGENVFTLRPSNGTQGTMGMWSGYNGSPWYGQTVYVDRVRIEPGVKAQTCDHMFAYFENVRSIEGLGNLDTSNVQNMCDMFHGCYDVEVLDGIATLDTSSAQNMWWMFTSNRKIKELDLSNWDMSNVKRTDCMFEDVVMTRLSLPASFRIYDENGFDLWDTYLPSASSDYPYTGLWVEEGDQDAKGLTREELMTLYTTSPRAATWVAKHEDGYVDPATTDLQRLRDELAKAKRSYDAAASEQQSAQSALDAAQAELDRQGSGIREAIEDRDNKKTAYEDAQARLKTAQDAKDAAQAALDANTEAIRQAQEELQAAQNAASGTAVADAEAQVQTAQGNLTAAQGVRDAAQAALNNEAADPGTNQGHEEWTAVGLYRHIVQNTEESDPAHWDAQAAVDILTSGTNTTGHSYGYLEGPVPDGRGASQWSSIYQNVDLASRNDAVSLDNLYTALDLIDEYNQYRARENSEEGCNLSTDVGINCRLMAIAAVQLDASRDYNVGHTKAYKVGENLAWGYRDPFTGWYDGEKADWKNGVTDGVGHYMNIVDHLPENQVNPTAATGFAVHTDAPRFSVAHGQVFHTTSGYVQYNPTTIYSTSGFRSQWLDPYYEAQKQSGMFGTTEEVHAQHEQDLADAQAAVDAAQSALDAANQALTDARAAAQNAQAAIDAANTKLQDEQAKTAGLQAALQSASNTVDTLSTEVQAAREAYEAAEQRVQTLDSDGSYARAQKAVEDATARLDAAKKEASRTKKAMDEAQKNLDDYTNIGVNPNIVVTTNPQVYIGEHLCPAPKVVVRESSGKTRDLEEWTDYWCSSSNATNAGVGTLEVHGFGDKGSGNWWGVRKVPFTIAAKPISGATIEGVSNKTYTGKAVTQGIVVKDGAKTLTPGVDYTVSYKNNVNVGTATVIVTGKGNYTSAKSVNFKITKPAKAASRISLAAQTKTYNGRAQTYSGKVTRSGSGGKVTYRYYSDAACRKEVKAANVKAAGTYYVRATLAADANFNGATSAAARLVIARAKVAAPRATNRPYTGKAQVGVPAGAGYRLAGTPRATKAGTYSVTATPDANHCWTDGKTSARRLTWKVVAPSVRYRTHVQTFGDQRWMSNGQASGTFGQAKRLEGIWIELPSKPVAGSIRYRTHVQTFGDQPWKSEGGMSGTSGKAKRLEAIWIELTGQMAKTYDVWYRVHAQTFGWMGWAKNGAPAGSAGHAKRLEAIQILVLPKGSKAPAANYGGYRQATRAAFLKR